MNLERISKKLKIGIFQTGSIPKELNQYFPSYPQMFIDCLSANSNQWTFDNFEIFNSVFPKDLKIYDGFIITGSAYGVYENLPWINNLFRKINEIINQGIPLVGICFGHQAIAQAINGLVEKSNLGWGAGVSNMEIFIQKKWFHSSNSCLNLIYSHQDQVIKLPKYAEIIAGNQFCPISSFCIDDKVFTLQGHPEFSNQYALKLLHLRKNKIGLEKFEKAKISLKNDFNEGEIAINWIKNFFERNFEKF